MKKYYRLLNYELASLFQPLILLCLGVIISPLPLLNGAMQHYTNRYDRFENVYHSSGCVTVFAVYFAALCGVCIKNIYSNYWGSKSIYTLLTLPVKREIVYLSKLTAFFICFMGLIAAQLMSVFIGYAFFAPTLIRSIDGQIYYPRIQNGLFLAFVRSDFLRIIFPLSLAGFVSSLSILITVVTALYYGALCERSRRFAGFMPIIIVIIVIIYTVSQRVNMNGNTYVTSLALLLFSLLFVCRSVKLVKCSAIA